MLLCNTAFRRLCSKLRNLQSTLVHISNQHINTSNSQQMSPQQTHNERMASRSTTYLPPTSRSPRTREGKALPPPHSSARDDEARRGGEKTTTPKSQEKEGGQTNQPKITNTPQEERKQLIARKTRKEKRPGSPDVNIRLHKCSKQAVSHSAKIQKTPPAAHLAQLGTVIRPL